jgi:glycosyltransferase involved in cell wall biosynthesis
MKILFLHCLAEPEGGAEVIVWELMRGLRDAGHECVLLAASSGSGCERSVCDGITVWEAGLRNVYWPFGQKRFGWPLRLLWHALDIYNPWMQSCLRRVVAEEKPDLACVHNLQGWSAASWNALTRLNVPVAQVLHDHYAICVNTFMHRDGRLCKKQCLFCRLFRLPHRALSRNVQAVIGVSRFILERHLSMGYFSGAMIRQVIHNARSPIFLGMHDAVSRDPHSGLRFGFIGRLSEEKGLDLLLQSFIALASSEDELWIAGRGRKDYEQRLRARAADGRIHFLGRVAPHSFYPRVDVVVVPSICNESFANVVAESLVFGKAVVAARRGGIPEVIRDGENGLLFDPDVPGDLEGCLIRMREDAELRSRLAANALTGSASFVDFPGWVGRYEDLFHELVARGGTISAGAQPAGEQ